MHFGPPQARPNFLVIQVDDQATNTFKPQYMPRTFRWIVDRGTRFTNGLAAPPLCCPDRAGVLTGQYPHHSGVFSNHPGYPKLTDKRDTLPVWLQGGGYRTGLVGKFLNRFDRGDTIAAAPGFDKWFELYGAKSYYDYDVSTGDRLKHFGSRHRDYSTDVFTARARHFIGSNAEQQTPFFLWLAYNAPHDSTNTTTPCRGHFPDPRRQKDYARFRSKRPRKTPAFNERDVTDKPPTVSSRPRLTQRDEHRIRRRFRCTLATVHRLDHGVKRVMDELRRDGELRSTIVVYLSDNGVLFGQHRVSQGKQYPYEPDLQVPFAIRVPPAYRTERQQAESRAVVSNVDLAPTLLDYAGDPPSCATPADCRTLDGRSMRPLLGGPGRWPSGRAVLAEIAGTRGTYSAIRARAATYVRYATGEQELYDLERDPFELRNLAGKPSSAARERRLAARLDALSGCAGVRGRDQQQPGHAFCE